MRNCIFCKIINKEIKSEIIYEDDEIIAFNDLSPQAPVHFLVIPKEHIESADNINSKNSYIIGRIFEIINKLTTDLKLDKGYRIINNCKEDGGQTVGHIHFHVLGGRQLTWPPG